MESRQRYTLNKTDRLKSRKQIGLLFKTGNSFSHFPFKVFWCFPNNQCPTLQTGFGVGSKTFKRAVDRNRIKRLMREAWRLQKNDLEAKLYGRQIQLAVFLIYTANEMPDYKQVFDKMEAALKKLKKITDEYLPAAP